MNMTLRKGLIGLALVIVGAILLIDRPPRPETEEAALLAHFGLSPRDYSLRGETLGQPALWETNLSFIQVRDRWYDTVHKIGDTIPIWYAGREGVFVVVRRPDGTWVGTRWLLVGGKLRLGLCRDEHERFCGLTLKRVDGFWTMEAPETRGPLP